MRQILHINACVRRESRTNRLARMVLAAESGEITELRLADEQLLPLDEALLEKRTALLQSGELTHPMLRCAAQFAGAEKLVIAAPYWDLSFPALLRAYLERVNVVGITFRYTPEGRPQSLCRAEELVFVTTAGGIIAEPNLGFAYLKAFGEIFCGIRRFRYVKAQGLDLPDAPVEELLEKAESRTFVLA